MQIKKQLIKYNTGGANKPIFIVIHDTGNTNKGAGAQNHYRYFNGGNRGASAIGKDYIDAVDKLVARGVISSPIIWKDQTYSKDNIKSLIIKIAAMN